MPNLRAAALAPALALLMLAACNGSSGDEEQARSGEVLEGTISDAMLPLDTVRSQPPLADPEAAQAVRAGSAVPAVGPDSAEDASPAAQESAGSGDESGPAADAEPAEAESADTDD